jgi:hypothetical protein
MGFPAVTNTAMTVDGFTYQHQSNDAAARFEGASLTVPGAKPGNFFRTAQINFAPGHGFVSGDVVNMFWAGGSTRKVTLTMSGDTASLGAGTGDPFPPDGTPLTAMKPTVIPVNINGAQAVAIGVFGAAAGFVTFASFVSDIAVFKIATANDGPSWCASSGIANPLGASTIAWIYFSHGSTSPRDMRAGVALN